jgi:uncharacterized SAM-binding protein YcdF (DUF218 family)
MLSRLEAPFSGPLAINGPLDAVLVLGGGTTVRPDGASQLGSNGDRLRVGARLQRQGMTRRLVTSGSSVAGLDQSRARDLSAETRALWIEGGVPASAIVPIVGPRNTREEIAAFSKLAAERGWQRIGVVSSAWHLRRAMRLAAGHELHAVAIPADFRGAPFVTNAVGLVPSGNGFYHLQIALKEYLGAALGR